MDTPVFQPWIRRGIAVGLLVLPWLVWLHPAEFREVYFLLAMLTCTALGAGFLFPDLIRPAGALADAIFGTGVGGNEQPPLDYRLARFYVEKERFEEALEEYLRIMDLYPRETVPYVEAIRLGAALKRPWSEVRQYYRRGMRRARGDLDAQDELRRVLQKAEDVRRWEK